MWRATRKKFPAGPSEGLKRWSLGPLNNSPLEYFTKVAREYGDIAGLRETAARGNAQLLTTAKDWVRLHPGLRAGIEVLDIEVRWRDPVMLHRVLDPFLPQAGDGRDARDARG